MSFKKTFWKLLIGVYPQAITALDIVKELLTCHWFCDDSLRKDFTYYLSLSSFYEDLYFYQLVARYSSTSICCCHVPIPFLY